MKDLGRSVCKGQKAISLCMPITVKRRNPDPDGDSSSDGGELFTLFKLAPRWFSLEQTEGDDYVEPIESPQWDADVALNALDIALERFEIMDGNVQGYAVKRRIAVNPLAEYPHKTRFHELAHVVLGHTEDADCHDAALIPRSIQEVEAEGVAFLLCSLLDLPGQDEARGFIQSWLDGGQLPEKSAQRIFSASQKILDAGKPASQVGSDAVSLIHSTPRGVPSPPRDGAVPAFQLEAPKMIRSTDRELLPSCLEKRMLRFQCIRWRSCSAYALFDRQTFPACEKKFSPMRYPTA
jgi:hypothetical protein